MPTISQGFVAYQTGDYRWIYWIFVIASATQESIPIPLPLLTIPPLDQRRPIHPLPLPRSGNPLHPPRYPTRRLSLQTRIHPRPNAHAHRPNPLERQRSHRPLHSVCIPDHRDPDLRLRHRFQLRFRTPDSRDTAALCAEVRVQ